MVPRILKSFALSLVLLWAAAASAQNNASVLKTESQVPPSVFPGSVASVTIRVQNTGNTTWSRSSNYRLGAGANQLLWQDYACGGYMNRATDGRVYLCRDVRPGERYDFTFRVLAPVTPGASSLQLAVRMVRDGMEWFGASASWDISVTTAPTNDASFDRAASTVPSSMSPGATARLRIRVRNEGNTTWSASAGYRLGTQGSNRFTWTGFACGGYMNQPGDGRVFLCHDVAPGAHHDFDFTVVAPGQATGSLTLSARMVRDGVAWFGESAQWSIVANAPVQLPDVVVDSVSFSPASPQPGTNVLFSSVVRNRGASPTPAGVAIGVGYFIDGGYVTWGAQVLSLAPGQSVTITTQGGAWPATSGVHTVTALVDDIDRFAEQDEQNNATSTTLTVGTAPPPPTTTGSLFGMNIDPSNPAGRPSAQQLKDIGVRWVRIEWKASRGFGFYDDAIASYRNAGLRVLLIVDYATLPGSPPSNGSDGAWLDYIARFTNTLRSTAAHYGNDVDAWQIWNEPDLFAPGSGYDPGIRPHLYGRMLRDGTAALRAHSSRPVVTAGLASGDPNYLAAARDAVGGLTVDAVAVHPYGQRAPDNWPHPGWGFGNMSTLFDRYLAFGLPLWVTEIGTVATDVQAAYLENVYELARTRYDSRVLRVFWFCWSDGMVPPFGVVSAGGDPKPAYWQYRSVAPPY